MPVETPVLRPVYAFDVRADGTAEVAPDTAPAPSGAAVYRWLHIDLSDPALATWCDGHLPPQATRTLLASKTRPRVEYDGDGLLLTLRGINMNAGFEQADMVSLRCWITAELIVTVRRQRMFAMEKLAAELVAGDAPPSPLQMIGRIAATLVAKVEDVSLELEDLADALEDEIYEGDQATVHDLAPLRRKTIKMRRHIGPLSEALRELSAVNLPQFPKDLRLRLRDTANSARRSLEELSEVQERLTALADHLDMAQAIRLERNGYRLSVAAGIFLPLGFLTGLFGVNLGGIPGTQTPYAFWILTAAMFILAVVVALIMRLLRWL